MLTGRAQQGYCTSKGYSLVFVFLYKIEKCLGLYKTTSSTDIIDAKSRNGGKKNLGHSNVGSVRFYPVKFLSVSAEKV